MKNVLQNSDYPVVSYLHQQKQMTAAMNHKVLQRAVPTHQHQGMTAAMVTSLNRMQSGNGYNG